jgi:protoheme IX farnesyltransferase
MSTVASEVRAKSGLVVPGDAAFVRAVALRLCDYVELAKPRIALMVLVTVTVGYSLGCAGVWSFAALGWAWLGIALAATGASAFNQWLERETDALMRRTQNRPLPAGRLSAVEVCLFATFSAVAGIVCLWWLVNPLTAVLTAATTALYAFVYTPLKRRTALCTAVGAIPGALPPVLGWTAAGQPLDAAAFALFGMLFLWQFPHFLAIAWLYRDDYAAAGLRMLPGTSGRHPKSSETSDVSRFGPLPHVTGLLAAAYALGLVPVSLLPAWHGLAGLWYVAAALVAGMVYAGAAVAFAWCETRGSARRLLLVSLVYLPVLFIVLAGENARLLAVSWGPQSVRVAAGTAGEN